MIHGRCTGQKDPATLTSVAALVGRIGARAKSTPQPDEAVCVCTLGEGGRCLKGMILVDRRILVSIRCVPNFLDCVKGTEMLSKRKKRRQYFAVP